MHDANAFPFPYRLAFEDEVVGDTLVNGLTYQIVERTGQMYNSFAGFPFYDYDTVSGTWYYRIVGTQVRVLDVYGLGSPNERLLYEFGLSVGDTLSEIPVDLMQVTEKGLKAEFLKPYNFDSICPNFGLCDSNFVMGNYPGNPPFLPTSNIWESNHNSYFLPNIGTIFREPYVQVLDISGQQYLLWSLTSNGQVLYKSGLATAIDPRMEASSFKLYPNPTAGDIAIQHDDAIESLSIYDLSGKLILEMQYPLPYKQLQLHLENTPKGLYWLEIQTEFGTERKSFVLE